MQKKIIFWITGAITLLVVVIIALTTSGIYLKRGIQGRLKQNSEMWSGDNKGMKRAYEPYYLTAGVTSDVATGGTMAKTNVAQTTTPTIRKLIKRAELNLEVKNCQETAQKIVDLVNNFSGIIIDSQIQKYANETKRGWTVLKVSPKDFTIVLTKLKELGKVDSERITGQDITEEYVDLESRLKNFQVVKARMLKILEEKAHQVKDILEVERELNRIGEQIEIVEGRMKYIDRQVALATITVNYYEPKAIAPESLNIIKRFKQTIRTAIEAFINVFNGVIIVIAAILPILIWILVIILFVLVVKNVFKKR